MQLINSLHSEVVRLLILSESHGVRLVIAEVMTSGNFLRLNCAKLRAGTDSQHSLDISNSKTDFESSISSTMVCQTGFTVKLTKIGTAAGRTPSTGDKYDACRFFSELAQRLFRISNDYRMRFSQYSGCMDFR